VLLNSENLTSVYLGLKVTERGGEPILAAVAVDGPAFRAGLREGDRLVEVGGLPVGSTLDYARAIIDARPAETIKVTVRRDGRPLTLSPVPMSNAAWAVARRIGLEFEVVTHRQDPKLLERATQQFYRELGQIARQSLPGVLRVTRVRENSPAASLGVAVGDILLGIVDRVPDLFGTRSVINRFDDIQRLNDALHAMSLRSRNPEYAVWILRQGDLLEGSMEIPRL
jgi:predicted metalloprotease with PDZ domain